MGIMSDDFTIYFLVRVCSSDIENCTRLVWFQPELDRFLEDVDRT